jgi:tetratricopeptide (TPR) repeat protein
MNSLKKTITAFLIIFPIVFNLKVIAAEETPAEKIEFGKNLMMMRDFVKAIDKFDEILKKDPRHPDALFNKSLCNFNLYEYKLALEDLNKLAGIVPNVSDVFNLRGLVKMGLKDTSAAYFDFNKAIILDKNFKEAYLNRGKTLIFMGKNEDALKDLVKAISLDSNVADMYYTKARAEHNLGLYRQAVDDFTTAMRNNYVNSDVFYRRGNSFFKDRDFMNAISDYTQVIYWEPLNPFAYNNRAFAFDSTGDTSRAKQDRQMIADIEYGLSLEPENTRFAVFSDNDSTFSIIFPSFFTGIDKSDKDSTVCVFVPEDEGETQHRIRVDFKIIPFYSERVRSKEPSDIIDHYRTLQDSLGTGFWRFELKERVTKAYKNYPSLLDKIFVQKDLKDVSYFIWNYGIAYGEHLIELNFRIPLPYYHYYSVIFAKSIESFVIRKIGQ